MSWRRRFQRWRAAERGTSAVTIAILTIPFIVTAFGYGFDSLRLVMVRESLEGSLNAAATAAVTATVSDQSKVYFDVPTAQARAQAIYQAETAGERGDSAGSSLACPTPTAVNLGVAQPSSYEQSRSWPSTPDSADCLLRFRVNAPQGASVDAMQTTVVVDKGEVCSGNGVASELSVGLSTHEDVPMTFLRIVGVSDQSLRSVTAYGYIEPECNL